MPSFPNIARSILVAVAGLTISGLMPSLFSTPVINEIMYRPGTAYPENEGLEFIEIHNPDSTEVDISGWAITTGADYTFPAGTVIPAGGFVVVAGNPDTLKSATGLATVFGPWKTGASLANKGEEITLSKPGSTADSWVTVDLVTYASEGDWSTRTRDSLGGWSWVSGAHDAGSSLERRNPLIVVDNGQNWASSSAAGGTPGAVNSMRSSNIAPVISQVIHSPAVPRSTDTITISCRLDDENAPSSLTAKLYWRNATTTSPGAFQTVAMVGNGNGYFSATLAAMSDKTIVEFYVSASDGIMTRTWPAPSNEGQNVNATLQVDNEVIAGTAPVYRLIMTAAENAAYNSLAQSNPRSDRMFHFTLVANNGAETIIRYRASLRFRGNSSRNYTIKPLRISLPNDSLWGDISDFTFGPRGAPWQYLAHKAIRAAGLVAADVLPVEVRRQGVEYTVPIGNAADYGKLVRVEEIDGDYLDNHWSTAVDGQIYRKTGISGWASTGTAPTNPDATWSGWSKQNNSGKNDWSDVMTFSQVWQAVSAPYFPGAPAGNVAAGTWNNQPFTDADIATLSTVADLDYLARWLAVMTVIPNMEPNLSTGEDDDYAAAFINDGTHTRMYPVPHDLDTVFGTGEVTASATSGGLYNATEVDTGGGQGGGGMGGANTQMKPLLPLLGNSTTPGNAAFRAKYLTAIRELLGSVFDADTSGGNSNPPFYQFVDNHLADWVPASARTSVKTFMTTRQNYLLNLIGAPKIIPTTATTPADYIATSTPTLRINEVLANNTKTFALELTYPDIIELANTGNTVIDLTDKSLSDSASTPREFVFPAGTTIAPGGFLTVFADSNTAAGGIHTGFGLDLDGDAVYLFDSVANGGALIDSIEFGSQIADYSISRTGTSGNTWTLTTPTIGAANGAPVTQGNFSFVKINEWAGNPKVALNEDFVELYNAATQPVALSGAAITDDLLNQPGRFRFGNLSFIAPGAYMLLDGDLLDFGLNGSFDSLFLVGQNGAVADRVDFAGQAEDNSTGRTPDGATAWANFTLPTPGMANTTSAPAANFTLLANLRITEIMYSPVAPSSAGNYEYVELQNIGASTLDLSGVRFTEGIDYTFPEGTSLAGGAYIVVAKNRTAFSSRYPAAVGLLAPGNFTGALDNSGEDIALTLPAPWDINILRFEYDPSWYPLTSTSGYSLVVLAPASTPARAWDQAQTWVASAAPDGSPGTSGVLVIAGAASAGGVAGQRTTLSIMPVSGSVTYQWQMLVNAQWIDLPGATGISYTIPSTQLANNGTYRVVVTISGNAVYSDPVIVTVATPAAASAARILNLSTRGPAQSSTRPLIVGFVINGSTNKRVLLRGIGPTLSTFNVSNVLADPYLDLRILQTGTSNYVSIDTNDNWGSAGDALQLTQAMASTGAFDLPSGSKDAVLLKDVVPGQYSAIITGVSAASGEALAEIYDADTSTPTARLVNVSTRGMLATTSDLLIAGFVISSEGSRTLLLRGVGPGLTAYGVGDALADPQIRLYGKPNGLLTDEIIAINDDWNSDGGGTAAAAAASRVGAFELIQGSKDASMVVTLPPGAYTLHANSSQNGTGTALIEVYVLP
ncbi:MAG: lamin tail domain-containing protein [Opitutaceae bacterium]|nr:lamin tail domain-containing protein [Opitutaceae bacterium]